MTNFIWEIVSMPAYPQANVEVDVVFQVNWQCHAQNGRFSAVSAGSVPVTSTAGAPYTPYDQLTQEQIWGWINPSIDRQEIESNLQLMIDEQKTPAVTAQPLPWSQA